MQNKTWTLIGVLLLLNGCSSPAQKSDIIVIDKSINQEVVNQKITHQQTTDEQTFVLSQKTKSVKKQAVSQTTTQQVKSVKSKDAVKQKIKHIDEASTTTKHRAEKAPEDTYKPIAPVKQQTLHNWLFPVTSKVLKHFSPQHAGITFDTTLGQAVRATAAGTVIYSDDKIKKHGKMVIIKHPLGFYSTYTQNHTLRVKQGDKVEQRDIIALTGKTDFYFEMKKFKTPIDPLKYLK